MKTNKLLINDKTYMLRLIDDHEIDEVLDLFKQCPDYFEMVEGQPASEESVVNYFQALPPDKELEDKYSIGIYEVGELVGAIDLVKDFPAPGTWIVGLILLTPAIRRNGVGTAVHEYIKEIAKLEEVDTLRVGVLKSNIGAIAFSKAVGYIEAVETDEVTAFNLEIKDK